MRTLCLVFAVLVATLTYGSALAADCVSIPMRGDNGTYNGCEIVHGGDIQFQDTESVSEAACPKMCEALSEIDALAAESHVLDAAAGFGTLEENR